MELPVLVSSRKEAYYPVTPDLQGTQFIIEATTNHLVEAGLSPADDTNVGSVKNAPAVDPKGKGRMPSEPAAQVELQHEPESEDEVPPPQQAHAFVEEVPSNSSAIVRDTIKSPGRAKRTRSTTTYQEPDRGRKLCVLALTYSPPPPLPLRVHQLLSTDPQKLSGISVRRC
ncbi:hypothetical protein BDV95DRAFT_259531 [Massariosphaeria phaeospora]|uniref:Uncharacterized protein n=1 Tax=Massariosphaeria phaeospora TaxID=100035 RepID=A0A7C8M212_9PLEO|nr:hypothetical protein BDV95DRAFT_259531 [Massariosphaeria phaeospora]